MAGSAYLDILRPVTLTKVVRQIVASADPILSFMGMQPGGANEQNYGHGREGIYHIYDDTRRIGKGRAPGTAAGRSSKQNMKAVPFVYPRMHDSVSLLAEFFHNLGRIADPAMRDEAGKDMIMRQTKTLTTKAANWRIAMVVGMMRDSLYIHESGDDWHWNYTSSGSITQIPFGVPAGNKSQLNMTDRASTSIYGANIITVPWNNPGADIPSDIAKINAARSAVGTGPVKHIHLNNILWSSIINNDYLAVYAGISQPPFTKFQRETGTRPDGSPLHEYIGTFNSLPGIEWHITDEGLDLYSASTGTFTFQKHFADTMAVMMGEPNATDKYTLYTGSEPIAEYDGGPETVRTGLSSWSKKTANPTATEVYILDNALAVPHDPFDLQIATVVF